MAQIMTTAAPKDDTGKDAISYQYRVELRQIDRLYDFDTSPNLSFLVGGSIDQPELNVPRKYGLINGKPGIVYGIHGQHRAVRRQPAQPGNGTNTPEKYKYPFHWYYFDGEGYDVEPGKLDVVQYDHSTEHLKLSRTFDRQQSKAPRNCWVYVFQARDLQGKTAKLLEELYFDPNGAFQRMGQSQLNASKDRWIDSASSDPRPNELPREITMGTPTESKLLLDVFAIEEGKHFPAQYFFYLAPWQLPWEAIEQIRQSPLERAVQLWDDFHTDVFDGPDPAWAQPLLPRPAHIPGSKPAADRSGSGSRAAQAPPTPKLGKRSYVVHLLNPIAEAQKRAKEYHTALASLEKELPGESDDDQYPLAKAVELFTMKSITMRALVEERLNEYLYPHGLERIERLQLIVSLLAQDLIAWIGYSQHRSTRPYWFRQPSDGHFDRPPQNLPGSRNCYEDAVWLYARAPEPVQLLLGDLINLITADLPQTTVGSAWLTKNLSQVLQLQSQYDKSRLGQDDKALRKVPFGALDYLFYVNTAPGKNLSIVLKYTNAIYASAWVRLKGQNALSLVEKWFEKRGVDLDIIDQPFGVKEILDDEKKELVPTVTGKKAQEHIATAKAGIKVYGFLRGTISLYQAISQLNSSSEPRKWFEASASLTDTISAYIEMKEAISVARGSPATVLRVVAPLAIYSNVIAVMGGIEDLTGSRSSAQGIGRGMVLMGSLVSLAGVSATGGAALIVYAVALVLQFAGKWITFEYEGANQFLRECAFGEPKTVPFNDRFFPEIMGGEPINRYHQLKKEGKWSFTEQRKYLEEIMHELECSLESDDWRCVSPGLEDSIPLDAKSSTFLVVRLRYPHCLTTNWTLRTNLAVYARGTRTTTRVTSYFRADELMKLEPTSGSRSFQMTKDGAFRVRVAELDRSLYAGILSSEELKVTGSVVLSNGPTLSGSFSKEIKLRTLVWTGGKGPTIESDFSDEWTSTPYSESQTCGPNRS